MLTQIKAPAMRYYDYRDGDVVEVVPERYGGWKSEPFPGIVDFRHRPRGERAETWVWVRKTGQLYSGGWYAHQVRLILRPRQDPALPVPDNVVLGSD